MAIKRTFVSDFTGKEITGDSAKVSLTIGDDVFIADAAMNDAIVKQIKDVGKRENKRGRKPKQS